MIRARRSLFTTAVAALGVVVSTLPAAAAPTPSTITAASVLRSADVSDGTPVLSTGANGFSPNDDGDQDTLHLTYETFTDGVQVLEVLDQYGELVGLHALSPVDPSLPLGLAPVPAGPGALDWDGRVNDGILLDDGSYALLLAVLRPENGTTCTDETSTDCYVQDVSANVDVAVVTAGPTVKVKSGGVIYPEQDGYKDSVTLSASMPNATGGRFTLRTSGGTAVRTWTSSGASWSTRWNGRSAAGKRVKAGTYRLTGVATGRYGNSSATSAATVTVKAGHLERRTRTRTLVPADRAYRQLSGDCSGVVPIESGADRGGQYFFSMALYPNCDYTGSTADLAGMEYHYTLPKAVKYGSIKLSGEGEGCQSYGTSSNSAALFLGHDLNDAESARMLTAHGRYATPSMPISRAADGRTLGWYVAVSGADCYKVRRFVARWSYYVIET